MRVTSALWVAAFIRRCQGEGAVATLARRGAEEAGAIAIVIDHLDGRQDLYLPAPQTAFGEAAVTDRLFQKVVEGGDGPAIRERIDRERRFDPDLWVVDVEDRDARILFDLAKE
ncbi:MAG: DUF1491 family protein [Rhizobiales bacterium]|nr:DUF1491 family protein [Hyphomicrobiales bacterium]